MARAVIFDMDGVITDTEPLHYKSYSEVFKEIGIELTFEEFINHYVMQGRGTPKLLEEHQVKADVRELRAKKALLFKNYLATSLKPVDGAPELVESLSREFLLALASSSHRYAVEAILDALKLAGKFDAVVAWEDVKKEKPDPAPFLLAAEKLGVPISDCVVIEDAEKGLKAAKRAGMKCILLPSVYAKDMDLSGADLVVNSLTEINASVINSF